MTEPEQNVSSEQTQHDKKHHIRDICHISLFAALFTVCAYVAVPLGEISFTLQTLAICVAGGLLGAKRGTLSVFVYILLGICGIPVFTGGKNFYAMLPGASAGYVCGFLFTALISGLCADRLYRGGTGSLSHARSFLRLLLLALGMSIGVAVCYLFGTAWYLLIYRGSATADHLQAALSYCVYPFLLPDFIKICAAAILVTRLKHFVKA